MRILTSFKRSIKLGKSSQRQNVLQFRWMSTNTNGEPLTRLEQIYTSGKVPETFNFANDVFDIHVAKTPSKIALWMENDYNGKQWSFTQLRTESVRAAISLQNAINLKSNRQNLPVDRPTDTLFMLLPRVPEWWFMYLASIRLGVVCCPATVMLSPEDIAYRLKACKAKVVITNEENMWKIEEALRIEKISVPFKIVVPQRKHSEIDSEGWTQYRDLTDKVTDSEILAFRNRLTKSDVISQIFFTSGTTAKPKMVAHTHASYGLGHYATYLTLGMKENDVFWCLCDPGWAKSSYGNVFTPWFAGACVYIHQMERFETKKVMEILRNRPITAFCAAPTLYRSMVQETDGSLFQFKSLKWCVAGGEALGQEVAKDWKKKTGMSPSNIYGQTETTALTEADETGELRPDSIGRAIRGFDIRIVDDAGNELPVGTEGNVGIKIKPNRPIGLFKGYVKEGSTDFEPDLDHKSLVGDFYLTGDLAYADKDNHFFYVGRTDDVIISAGYRIGPFEVETVLQTHPAVAENAVVASPDKMRGAVVKAFIILSDQYRDADKTELAKSIQDYFKKKAAPYKYPRKIEFVDSLPKTISGKILRRELRKQEFSK